MNLWEDRKKLASCESSDPGDRCPESLGMYVGNKRRPPKNECDPCRQAREIVEGLEDVSGEDQPYAAQAQAEPGSAAGL